MLKVTLRNLERDIYLKSASQSWFAFNGDAPPMRFNQIAGDRQTQTHPL